MNSAAKATRPIHSLPRPTWLAYRLRAGTLVLIVLVLLSGLAVIYLADINRHLAMGVEEATNTQNQLHLEWGKLLLEQSTWSTQARIQSIAAQHLGMQTPTSNQIVMLKTSP